MCRNWFGLALAVGALLVCSAGMAQQPQPAASSAKEVDLAYLDDLQEVKSEVGYAKLGKHGATTYRELTPQKFWLNGAAVAHTLGMVPPAKGAAYAVYNLNGRYARFRSTVALNVALTNDGLTEVKKDKSYNGASRSPATFRVVGDGKELWSSKSLQKHGTSEDCDISIAGVKELRLEAAVSGEMNYCFSFWANPRVFNMTTPDAPVASASPPKSVPKTEPALSTPPSKPMPEASKPPSNPPAVAATTPAKPLPTGPKPSPENPKPATPTPTPSKPDTTSPAEAADAVKFTKLDLSDPATFMAASEDGDYLFFSHLKEDKVTVWDITAGKVSKTISTPAPRCLLFRGDTLFVSHANEGKIRSFSRKGNWKLLDEFALKKSPIQHLSAPQGEDFKGEILVTCHGKPSGILLLNTKKDVAVDVSGATLASFSGDGKVVMTQAGFGGSPSGMFQVYAYPDFLAGNPRPVIEGGELETPYLYQARPGLYWFGADMAFRGVMLQKLAHPGGTLSIPDVGQPVYYSLTRTQLTAKWLNAPLTEIGVRTVAWTSPDASSNKVFDDSRERRRHYLLDAPYARTRNGKLHLFAIANALGAVWAAETKPFVTPGTPVAAATSVATKDAPKKESLGLPEQITEGQPFSGKLKGPGGAEFELMKGPDGLTLSKNGDLAWAPSKSALGVHELKIRVTSGSDVEIVRQNIEVVDAELFSKDRGRPEASETGRLVLEFDHHFYKPSPDYHSMLLLQGDWLRILGPDGVTVSRELKLPSRYMRIAARQGSNGEDTFVALVNNPPKLDLIDGKTGKLQKSIPLQKSDVRVLEVVDYDVHPQRPVTYVTVKHDIELPRYRILVVDEATGKIDAPDDLIGTWVKVDPSGQYLYAGYRDLYTKGVKFHMNPGWNLISTPEYGNVDWLMTYELRGQKMKFQQLVPQAGGNGSDIILSPDAKRITYLSHVGTPMHSRNLVAWNPRKLKDEPVTYALKDRGTTLMLAFHPTLPLVAVPGGTSAVLFNRDSGELLEDKLVLTSVGLGDAKVSQLYFSPDGMSLVFVCADVESGRYLRPVKLRLAATERTAAARGLIRVADGAGGGDSLSPANLVTLKRDEIESLKPAGKLTSQSHSEVSRRYTNSVVVIKTDEGSGSGFVIGKRGIVLTCAHVISDEGDVTVSYNTVVAGKPKLLTAKAKLARIDKQRDLALLKFSPIGELTPVILADDGVAAESGEEVTVIGNPGLGSEILNHTVTTGVVSSTSRELEGLKYLQTSAAVNAGNSGGPVFGAKGQVIGLVVLKANLEATAFAVPASSLREFVEAAVAAK